MEIKPKEERTKCTEINKLINEKKKMDMERTKMIIRKRKMAEICLLLIPHI